MRGRIGLVSVVAGVVAVAASCAIPLGDLGGPSATAGGINEAGVVVGSSEVPGSTPEQVVEHAFKRLPDGTVTDLGTLTGSGSSAALRINEGGTIIGWSTGPVPGTDPVEEATRAVRWDPSGAITDLGTLGGSWAEVRDLDDAGRVVGFSATASGDIEAFVFDPAVGHMTALAGLPGGGSSYALGMNDQGDAVGYQWAASGLTASPVRWDLDLGTITDLSEPWGGPGLLMDIGDSGAVVGLASVPTPSGSDTQIAILRSGDPAPVALGTGSFGIATSINGLDVVVGYRTDDPAGARAFRWEQSTGPVALDPTNESYAWDISDAGQMVGRSSARAAIFVA